MNGPTPFELVILVLAMLFGFSFHGLLSTYDEIDLQFIPAAEARSAQAEGLKSLTVVGKFVCNNGLYGTLENAQ